MPPPGIGLGGLDHDTGRSVYWVHGSGRRGRSQPTRRHDDRSPVAAGDARTGGPIAAGPVPAGSFRRHQFRPAPVPAGTVRPSPSRRSARRRPATRRKCRRHPARRQCPLGATPEAPVTSSPWPPSPGDTPPAGTPWPAPAPGHQARALCRLRRMGSWSGREHPGGRRERDGPGRRRRPAPSATSSSRGRRSKVIGAAALLTAVATLAGVGIGYAVWQPSSTAPASATFHPSAGPVPAVRAGAPPSTRVRGFGVERLAVRRSVATRGGPVWLRRVRARRADRRVHLVGAGSPSNLSSIAIQGRPRARRHQHDPQLPGRARRPGPASSSPRTARC